MNEGVALLFPGQGAQYVGMGRAAYAASADARDLFGRADAALDFSLSSICFDGPEERLRETRFQQPAILAVSLVLLAAHEEVHTPLAFVATTGHSLGLYSALVATDALRFEDALKLVALRGELMQRASGQSRGGMAAVLGVDHTVVENACEDVSTGDDIVVAANYNAPGQVVISGTFDALARATQRLKELGARKVVPLEVAGPFHSPLMRPAAEAFRLAVDDVTIRRPRFPIVGNSTPYLLCEAEQIRTELLKQIEAPVRWTAAVASLVDAGVSSFVDCGPGTTLAGLVKRIAPESDIIKLDVGRI